MENRAKTNQITNAPFAKHLYHHMPQFLLNLTKDYNGREKDIILLSSITAVSSCLPNYCGLYDKDILYPNLFTLISAPAASGKGVMNKARFLVQKIHKQELENSKIKQAEWKKAQKEGSQSGAFPEPVVKILPANSSSAEVYSYLGSGKQGVLMIESEADTLGNMLTNDWSSFSDVLRKAFHHEPISISRKMDKLYLEIEEPKLSLLLSGTPDQIKNLVKSKENGLFSRFMVYAFDEVNDFKDVFSTGAVADPNIPFITAGNNLYDLYLKLIKLPKHLQFHFTESQKKKFLKQYRNVHSDIYNNYSSGFLSHVFRYAVIHYRIAMVITALRYIESIGSKDFIVCSDWDYLISKELTSQLIKHTMLVYDSFEDGILSETDSRILFSLPTIFERHEAITAGEKEGVPKRTMDEKLKKWRQMKCIHLVSHGKYQRTRIIQK